MKKYWTMISTIDYFRPLISIGDDIKDYYIIDRYGNVFSRYSGIYLKHLVNENGYEFVTLETKNNKRIQRKVSRLVMYTFNYIYGCEYLQVDHKNGNKHDNFLGNLEWVTGKENVNRAIEMGLRKSWNCDNNPNAKLNSNDVIKIVNLALFGYSDKEINNIIPIASLAMIKDILLGNTWTDLIPKETIKLTRELRMPTILTVEQKHNICKYFENNISKFIPGYGATKLFILNALEFNNITINDSTYRMAKRLFLRYQDYEITNLYNY